MMSVSSRLATAEMDRFHVEQGFKRVIDTVRREEYAKVTGRERNAIKGLMYLLYIHPGNLRRKDRRRLWMRHSS